MDPAEAASAPLPPRCPRCDAALPPDAPAGLCPACLVSAHFGAASDAREPASAAPSPPIEEIAPHFPQLEILACLGRGGMGVVYRARQKSLGRLVALKLLAPERGGDPAFAERFAREAQALARLDHPHIVTIHDFGRAGGYFFLLMEFVDGVTLRQLIQDGRVSAREALAIVPQICDALQFAHDHGVVHRDIKPENILLDRRGQVKVADFGLAKLAGPGVEPGVAPGGATPVSDAEFTGAGHVMGTPCYMAPEQRERPGEVDHRADIYALGVVLYQMLTGELPGENRLEPPSRRVRIDVRLDEVVLRALERDPGRRYSSATEFRTRLETVAAEPPAAAASGASPAAPAEEAARRVARARLKPPAIALIVTSALDLVGLLLGAVAAFGIFRLLAAHDPVTLPGGLASGFRFAPGPEQLVTAPVGLAIATVVGRALVNIAADLFVIFAARRMLAGRDPARARAGAIVAIVIGALGLAASGAALSGLLSLLQAGAGVWAWVALSQARQEDAFPTDEASAAAPRERPAPPGTAPADGPTPAEGAEPLAPSPESRRVALARLKPPAVALIATSALDLTGLILGAVAIAGILSLMNTGADAAPSPDAPASGRFAGAASGLVIAASVGWRLAILAANLFVISGARRMLAGRDFRRAKAAAIVAVVIGALGLTAFRSATLSLAAISTVLQLGAGLWAWVSLSQKGTAPAFSAAAPEDERSVPAANTPDSVARLVSAPAIGLLVAAILQLVVVAAAFVALFWIRPILDDFGMRRHPSWVVLGSPVPLGAGALVASLVLVAALRMLRLRNRGLALFGAILATGTLTGLGLGVLFGVWALVVLLRRDVRRAFDERRPAEPSRGVVLAACVPAALLLLVEGGALVLRFRRSMAVRTAAAAAETTLLPPGPAPEDILLEDDFAARHAAVLPFAPDGRTGVLDLETGLTVLPAEKTPLDSPDLASARIPGTGISIIHDRGADRLTLVALGGDILGLDHTRGRTGSRFDPDRPGASPGDRLPEAGSFSRVVSTAPASSGEHRFLFRTRSGAAGVLRVAAIGRDAREADVAWMFFPDAAPGHARAAESRHAGKLAADRAVRPDNISPSR